MPLPSTRLPRISLELLALGTPFFALLPEAEPPFLSSAFTALSASGFGLRGLALRTEHDPIQLVWERGERLTRESSSPNVEALRTTIEEFLAQRGEPVGYLHLKAAALGVLEEAHALRKDGQEFDQALRGTETLVRKAVKEGPRFIHHSTGETVEAGLWGLLDATSGPSLTDQAEVIVVKFLQRHPESIFLEVEHELYEALRGLLTPSQGITHAILSSYASKDDALWRLRPEDTAARRQEDLRAITAIIQATGKRLGYEPRAER